MALLKLGSLISNTPCSQFLDRGKTRKNAIGTKLNFKLGARKAYSNIGELKPSQIFRTIQNTMISPTANK